MVNLERLRTRGLRAYETGRARMASRIALILIPAAAVCLLEGRGRQTCACLAVLLLGLTIWLRWRDRRGTEAVTTGLLAGSFPLAAGIVLARLGFRCETVGADSFCTAFSVVAGIVAGAFIAAREVRQSARLWSWLTAGTVAGLAASLGCVRLGTIGVVGVAGGMALGTLVAAGLASRSS